jgi:dTDP-4-dehydrorhamnose reductase
MRLLITGASGFFGWNAVRYFVRRGHDVIGTFRSLSHYLHQIDNAQFVRLDLADEHAPHEVATRFQPDLIIHAAALARPQQGSADQLHTVNVSGTERFAEAAASINVPIIYLSTDLVYAADAGICDERTPEHPSGAGEYSRTKLLGEQRVRSTAQRWIIIRPSLMFGDGPPGSNSFSMFIDDKWRRGERAPLFSDQFRAFLFVEDLCTAIEQVAIVREAWNELFVCGGSEHLSRSEFGLRYADASGVDRGMVQSIRSTELEGYVGGASDIRLDSSKLRSLGWQSRPLEVCFEKMLREREVVQSTTT